MKTQNSKLLSLRTTRALALVLSVNLAVPAADAAMRHLVAWGNTNSWAELPPSGDLTSAISIAGSSSASRSGDLALTADGSVLAWGYDSSQTIAPPGLTNVVAISAGGYENLALRVDGQVIGWDFTDGGPDFGGLAGLSDIVAVAAGATHNLALRANGEVIAWGFNDFGDADVPAGLSNVVAVAAGVYHSLALKADGTVVAWGANGTLCCTATGNLGETQVPVGLSNVVAIAAGRGVSLAVKADGAFMSWGAYYDPLGGGDKLEIPEGLTNVVAVSAGDALFGLALKADGTVVAFGASNGNLEGQMNVLNGLTNVVAIAACDDHCLALVGDEPSVLQLAITNSRWDSKGFSVSVAAQRGRVCRLEYKDSLLDPNWTALPLVVGNGGVQTLTDFTTTRMQRFYRVRQW
jgi:alpha-tubulin suppressor-like RCC1 family protein